ncbi:putative tRNA-dihydrouridine synthase [Paratrimastix pyriformis]|uniref:tRNA-dihydrouridine synthase n=1 Tax=Paratrimastix pyriformis TaxID=342808 RepID=A0ABQ8URU8_9EUKA|nr:putative tRNA-dihydrouridine synthase [Paratrimastix pyriformis]
MSDATGPSEDVLPRGRPTLQHLFETNPCVKVSGPMVRYSKLPARLLWRKWGCDLVYTPMFVASCFAVSQRARDCDFTTTLPEANPADRPLIVQFAVADPQIFVNASRIAFANGSCDGVDINCGCPQKWVCTDGYGSSLLERPQDIVAMLRAARDQIPEVPVSVKIRHILADDELKNRHNEPTRESLYRTIELAKAVQDAGACPSRILTHTVIYAHGDIRTRRYTHTVIYIHIIYITPNPHAPCMDRASDGLLTVHGRTAKTSSSVPVCLEGIKMIKETLSIPVIANGDIFAPDDVLRTQEMTGVNGVMSARGLLQNPALYAGYNRVPAAAVQDFLDLSIQYGLSYHLLHNHLMFMLYPVLARAERRELAECASLCALMDFCAAQGLWTPFESRPAVAGVTPGML